MQSNNQIIKGNGAGLFVQSVAALILTFQAAASSEADEDSSTLPLFQLKTFHNDIWSPVKSNSVLHGCAEQLDPASATKLLHGGISFSPGGDSLSTVQHL